MIEAYVMVMTGASTSRSVLETLRETAGVEQANIVAGEFDIIARVQAESPQALLRLVTDDIQSLEDIGRTRTCIILE